MKETQKRHKREREKGKEGARVVEGERKWFNWIGSLSFSVSSMLAYWPNCLFILIHNSIFFIPFTPGHLFSPLFVSLFLSLFVSLFLSLSVSIFLSCFGLLAWMGPVLTQCGPRCCRPLKGSFAPRLETHAGPGRLGPLPCLNVLVQNLSIDVTL